jgi:general secretion pathway protein D
MKTNKSTTFPLRALAAAVLLSLAIAPALPAQAQAPAVADNAALSFVGADMESVIKAIGHYTNTTFVIDPRVKGTLTLVSERPLTKAQAFSLLTTQLRLQGYAVVMGDGYAKVVPEADAKLQPGTIRTGKGAPRGDQIVTQVFRLNFESAANMVTVLRPLISPNNTINANPGNNTLVITDYADNLRRLGRLIDALDASSTTDIDIVPIRYAIASDIAAMVTRLMDAGPADAGRVILMADPRTNSVAVRAPTAARANFARQLIAKLDQPTAQAGNVHVVYLKNAEATKLAATLRAVMSGDTSALPTTQTNTLTPGTTGGLSSGPGQTGSTSNTATSGFGASANTGSSALGTTGGAGGFIQADASTNTLIITASEPVYRNLRGVIDMLDMRRAQVYIESMVVEVTADKAAELGIQWIGLSGNANSSYRVGAINQGPATATNNLGALLAAGSAAVPGPGFALGVFRQINGQLTLGAIASALQSDADTNILSTPNVTVLDNEEANVLVGQNVPFITGQFTTAASGGSSNVNPFQTVERKDVGLQLRIKPQISEGGTIKLRIYQESSNVADATGSAGIITNKRSIDTTALADDGQILVLGGLIEDSTSDTVQTVPVLSSIRCWATCSSTRSAAARRPT